MRPIINKSFYFFVFLFVFVGLSFADDPMHSRSVKGEARAQKSDIVLNQIDTSKFPDVHVFATVTKDGKPLQGLTSADFEVREDEVDQEPITVVPEHTPLTVAITLDVSGSMKKALPKAQQAAISFVDALEDSDAVSVLSFQRQVKNLVAPTKLKDLAKSALSRTVARGDTALYDALYQSVDSLKDVSGRKAVILLSDGIDDDGYGNQLSKRSVLEVISLTKKANIPIFTIGLGKKIDKRVLSTVGKESGGEFFQAPTADDLQGLYKGIGKRLSGQYNIYYTSNLPGDGSEHRVQLSFAGLKSVKEYTSPQLVTKLVAKKRVVEEKKTSSRTKTIDFGLGTIRIPDLKHQYVKLHRDGKEVESFSSHFQRYQVPAGEYQLLFGEYSSTINVKEGEDIEIPLAIIKIPGLKGQYVKLSREGKEVDSFSPHSQQCKVPAGGYTLKFGKYGSQEVTVEAGEVLDLAVPGLAE